MHVALVTPSFAPATGGLARVYGALAQGLRDAGTKVTVVHAYRPSVEALNTSYIGMISVVNPDGSRCAHANVEATGSTLDRAVSVGVLRQLEALSRQCAIDVVEFTNWRSLGWAHSLHPVAPQIVRIFTSIDEVLEPDVNTPNGATEMLLQDARMMEQEVFHASALRIYPGQAHRQKTTGRLRSDRTPWKIRPPGILSKVPHASKQFGHPLHLLYVGRLSWRKGFDVLMEGLPMLNASIDWTMDVVGEDSTVAGLSAWQYYARRLPDCVRERVTYHGVVEDNLLQALYTRSHAVIAPSRYESFGLSYIEGMAAGTLVVAMRGAAEEVITDECGLFFDSSDSGGWAALLNERLQDLDECAQRASRARAYAYLHYTIDNFVRDTVSDYCEVVSRSLSSSE